MVSKVHVDSETDTQYFSQKNIICSTFMSFLIIGKVKKKDPPPPKRY